MQQRKEGGHCNSNFVCVCVCVKDEKGDLLGDSHSILNRRKNHLSNLMYVILMKLGRFKCIRLNR
jgi:hypothetical protein